MTHEPLAYGKAPKDMGLIDVGLPEVMYYLYLPVKLRDQHLPTLPKPLAPLMRLLAAVRDDLGDAQWGDNYVYMTVKKMFVSPTVTANRPGWHADGFGTSDLNYVWYDSLPTEFSLGSHFNITDDHVKSLEEFAEQAPKGKIVTYPEKHLLRLDPHVVHRVAEATEQMMRTFVKISVSKAQYNLKDNSINHGLRYGWRTYDREVVRNNPNFAQADFYKAGPDDDHFK